MRLYGLVLSVSGLLAVHARAEADKGAPEAVRPLRIMVNQGVNSDAGLNGSVIQNERNFEIAAGVNSDYGLNGTLVVNERNFDFPGSQPSGASAVADYYQHTGHPQAATFYRRLAQPQVPRTRTAQQVADFYQRTGHPEAAEFYRRIATRRHPGR